MTASGQEATLLLHSRCTISPQLHQGPSSISRLPGLRAGWRPGAARMEAAAAARFQGESVESSGLGTRAPRQQCLQEQLTHVTAGFHPSAMTLAPAVSLGF